MCVQPKIMPSPLFQLEILGRTVFKQETNHKQFQNILNYEDTETGEKVLDFSDINGTQFET